MVLFEFITLKARLQPVSAGIYWCERVFDIGISALRYPLLEAQPRVNQAGSSRDEDAFRQGLLARGHAAMRVKHEKRK